MECIKMDFHIPNIRRRVTNSRIIYHPKHKAYNASNIDCYMGNSLWNFFYILNNILHATNN